jgi:hypothetical protein
MFFEMSNRGACSQMAARLEDYVGRLSAEGPQFADEELTVHLAGCERCRRAVEEARTVSALLLAGRGAAPDSRLSDPYFASRVMARIREYETARAAGAEFWPALESLSLRLSGAALSAALILGAWAAWQWQTVRTSAAQSAQARSIAGEPRQPETRVLFPEMKRPPQDAGEAMLVMASAEQGRQR